jgi:hypothetical protein
MTEINTHIARSIATRINLDYDEEVCDEVDVMNIANERSIYVRNVEPAVESRILQELQEYGYD